jgi:hypothetical protein
VRCQLTQNPSGAPHILEIAVALSPERRGPEASTTPRIRARTPGSRRARRITGAETSDPQAEMPGKVLGGSSDS